MSLFVSTVTFNSVPVMFFLFDIAVSKITFNSYKLLNITVATASLFNALIGCICNSFTVYSKNFVVHYNSSVYFVIEFSSSAVCS